MSRAYCYQCHRASSACLCGQIEKQANQVEVIVLQHPDEKRHAKGSAIIAELGLQKYQRFTGEDFCQHEQLSRIISENRESILLLYPGEKSETLNSEWVSRQVQPVKYLLVIDATWRKAHRIWQLNPALHNLVTVSLAERQSKYRIRKEPRADCLSTVESVVYSLRELESEPERYQSLLDLFSQMIDFQIKNMGSDTYQKNYTDK